MNGWLTVSVNQGDICDEKVDVIVNAANNYLSHGEGIAEHISKVGGR